MGLFKKKKEESEIWTYGIQMLNLNEAARKAKKARPTKLVQISYDIGTGEVLCDEISPVEHRVYRTCKIIAIGRSPYPMDAQFIADVIKRDLDRRSGKPPFRPNVEASSRVFGPFGKFEFYNY